MKTIVIPAHSSDSAIKLFKLSLQLYREEPLTCWFLDIRRMPGNYNDLFTVGRTCSATCDFGTEFCNRLDELISVKDGRVGYRFDHIYGDSSYVFRNYLQFREADLVIYDKKEWQNSKKETGLNIFRMVSQCGCELMYVSERSELVSNYPADNGKSGGHVATNSMPRREPAYTKAPASVQFQFQALDNNLASLEKKLKEQNMISVKLNNLSRYFLKEDALQKLMVRADCSLLLLQK